MLAINDYFEKLETKIFAELTNRGFVFLIKTEDYIFDEFLKEKLTEKKNIFNNTNLQDLSKINFLESKKNNDYEFIDFPKVNDEILATLINHYKNKDLNKVIYYLPKNIINKFFDHESVEDLISSCIFISEKQEYVRPLILEKSLKNVDAAEIDESFREYLSVILDDKKISLSKITFYASAVITEKKTDTNTNYKSKILSIETFLDEKGKEFLNSLSDHIPIETIEVLFRAFVFIEKEGFIHLTLDLEEITSYSQVPIDQVNKFIDLALSKEFQILTKKKNLYTFKILEYLSDWSDLKNWIKNEESAFKQKNQLEALAKDYFQSSGTLLSKEQIEQALNWKAETLKVYTWEKKYKLDKELISSYILLSQNYLEESLKKQQKKRSRLLKNSIRISIAVSIAFLLSSFTALIAYLERNSAIKQNELAIQAKEDADQARKVAEMERLQAIEARQNESLALGKAEAERLLALDAKGQAEVQKKNALSALDQAKKSEIEASRARAIAEKNEQLANEAREIAQVNFKTSERLRNQQEARASALEALGHFANEDYEKGIQLAKAAYNKNINNSGFPLQSDIFYALLYGKLNSEESQLEIDLEHPAKFITLSNTKDRLAIYTINGQIRIYNTKPKFVLSKVIDTGYIQSMEFINNSQIIYTNLNGNLLIIDTSTSKTVYYNDQLLKGKYKELLKIPGQENIWIASGQNGGADLLNYQMTDGFFKIKEKNGGKIQAMCLEIDQIAWAEGNKFFTSSIFEEDKELLFTAPSEISSITWSKIHKSWVVGSRSGQLIVINPNEKENNKEIYAVHGSQVSHLKILPYVFDTELMFSTGFDGSIYIYVLDKNLPFSGSISSKISFPKHRSWITGFVIDSEKKLAYSISNDRSLKIWPLAIEELL